MTFMLTCDCPAPTSDCSLEHVLNGVLEADLSFTGVQVYLGGLAAAEDTGDVGPTIPYVVLSDLGANNSVKLGENLVQHEVIVRLRVYATTDKQGLLLAQAALAAWQSAGQLDTAYGYACRGWVPAWPRPAKLGAGRWLVQANQLFFLHNIA